MKLPLANYEDERQQFAHLVEPESPQRILMFQGESGSGKTRLLEECAERLPPNTRYAWVQMRGGDTTPAHIFYRLGRRIGWERLTTFTRHIAELSGTPDAYSDRHWQIGLRDHIQKLVQLPDMAARSQRRAALTDAWFADAGTFASPMLLILDTYEEATTELDQWMCNQFLPWVADTDSVRVLVAGQTVPERSGDWRTCCSHYQLQGVKEAEAWLPVAEALGREIASLDFLAGVCAAFNGNPAKILEFINLQPQKAEPAPPRQTITITRSQIRKNMTEHFELLDIRELCFDFDVQYETLGSQENVREKVMALIEYMENRGRLPELVDSCRELRPHLDW